ncbi:MAG: ABC transporter ATP-binding protein [Actinomycetota bacterium]|nr:ABC transporter ATP-binding protein [Actinomycetota bacterium]
MIEGNDSVVDFGGRAGLARVWRLLRGHRRLAAAQSLLSLAEGLIEAAILTVFARVALTAVTDGAGGVEVPLIGERSTSVTLSVLGILIMIRLLIGALVAMALGHLQFQMVTAIRSQVVISYSRGSWRSQSELDEGGLQQLLVTLPNSASSALSGLLTHFGHLLIMTAMLSYALFADPLLTLALIAAIVGASLAFIPLRRWIKSRSARVLDRQRSLSTAATELSALKFEVQAFGIGERISRPLRDLIVVEGRLARRLSVVKSMVVPLYTTMTYSAVAVGLVILQGTTADGLDDVGPILLVVLRSLAYGQGIQQAAVAIASLVPILDFLRDQVESFDSHRVGWGSKSLVRIDRIQLDDVSYAYSEADGSALRDAFVTINRGERIGIVGPSGSGKSTLVRLLLGLVVADKGRVLVNEAPIHEHDREMWSQRIGVVPQAAQVVHGPLADNLRMYRDGISDDDLWWALGVADLIGDVRAMPDGLGTTIGAGARALSGGQQQRLAIARAFATRPDLVVMDEPTSSIDAMSEAAVSDAIERLPDDVTIIIVSHRMRILRGCDRLIVVENGEITANGTPEQVIDSSPYLVTALEA